MKVTIFYDIINAEEVVSSDFEGSFQIDDDIVGGLYTAKEDPDVLMVEFKNGEYTDYVILIKEQ